MIDVDSTYLQVSTITHNVNSGECKCVYCLEKRVTALLKEIEEKIENTRHMMKYNYNIHKNWSEHLEDRIATLEIRILK